MGAREWGEVPRDPPTLCSLLCLVGTQDKSLHTPPHSRASEANNISPLQRQAFDACLDGPLIWSSGIPL